MTLWGVTMARLIYQKVFFSSLSLLRLFPKFFFGLDCNLSYRNLDSTQPQTPSDNLRAQAPFDVYKKNTPIIISYLPGHALFSLGSSNETYFKSGQNLHPKKITSFKGTQSCVDMIRQPKPYNLSLHQCRSFCS